MKLSLHWPWRSRGHGFAPTLAGWQESTHAELAWRAQRGAATRWAWTGAVLGLVGGLVAFAPAAWLSRALAQATGDRLLLAEPRGTVWNGSAVLVLTGGPDSRDASALPGRLQWTLGLRGLGLELRAQHSCCMSGQALVHVAPGLGRMKLRVNAQGLPMPGATVSVGQWPAGWLAGLGTPWNTMQLGGTLKLSTTALEIENVSGRWRMSGRADFDLIGVSSRLSTLPTLGSYRISLSGDAGGTPQIDVSTLTGAMRLTGNGQLGPRGVYLRGEASAEPADEAALANLLNIIGRRQGARSVIAIG